jgi:hypothetical protein
VTNKYEVTLEIEIRRYVGGKLQGQRAWAVTHDADVQIDKLEDCIAYVAGSAEKLSTLGKEGAQ